MSMNKQTLNKLLKMNNKFYSDISDDFSITRKYAWRGWEEVASFIKRNYTGNVQIVDLGCGNGRFLEFLNENLDATFSYIGFDNNERLLEIANKMKRRGYDLFNYGLNCDHWVYHASKRNEREEKASS